jgi:integrative and conjugative element protein (TIGR02256 family)
MRAVRQGYRGIDLVEPAPGRLFLPAGLLEDLAAEAHRYAPRETGGMLLGYRRLPTNAPAQLVVTDTVGAGPKARRRRLRFAPDGRWQEQRLEEIYERSGRHSTFLGDWHSHPRGAPRPSLLDRRTYARVAAAPQTASELVLVLILALNDVVRPGAFLVDRRRHVAPLEVLDYTP